MIAMGLFEFMGIGGTPEKQIERHLKKVKQGYAQPEYRRGAMEALLKMGTPEAYFALCKRFAVVSNSAYWDEEEKRWLVETFIEQGTPAVEPLKRFVHEVDNVNYPVRALKGLLEAEELTTFLLEALRARAPDDYRRDKGKLELIDHIGRRDANQELVDAILPYLADHSDDVICKTIEVLEDWQLPQASPDLYAVMLNETLSARVQRRAAQAIALLSLESEEDIAGLPEAVAEDYKIDGRTLRSSRPAKGAS